MAVVAGVAAMVAAGAGSVAGHALLAATTPVGMAVCGARMDRRRAC